MKIAAGAGIVPDAAAVSTVFSTTLVSLVLLMLVLGLELLLLFVRALLL